MKHFIHILFLFVCFAVCAEQHQLCPTPVPEEYRNVQEGSVVAAYFGNWDVYGENHYQIDKIEAVADKLTHIVYGFMKPDELTGRCKVHDLWADLGGYDGYQTKVGGNFAKMMALKKKFPHLKFLLSVGGGTYNKNLLAIAQNKTKVMKFAQSCVDMLDFYEHSYVVNGSEKKTNRLEYKGLFDGLDIDWEFNSSQLTDDIAKVYTEFIHEVARLLQIRDTNPLLTVALQVTPKVYNTLELANIAQKISWFHVMAYDFYGPSSGLVGFNAPVCNSNAAYSVDGALQNIIQRGVSPEKIVLGLPLYGYVYEQSAGYKSTIKKSAQVKAMSYHLIKSKYIDNAHFKKGWNSYEKSSSLYSKHDNVFVSYDGKEALGEKVRLAKHKKLQGVVLWRLSGDDDQHTIVNAIAQKMKQ